MKAYAVLLMITISLTCQAQNIDLTKVHNIEAKIGLPDYPLDKTTLPEIIAAFGNNYEKGENNIFRESETTPPNLCEIKYKNLGVSFYYLDNDKTQTIKAVKFYKPFKVKTKTNIILNESNIGDVLKIYENSRLLISGSGIVTVNSQELSTVGIRFSSQISNFNLDEFPSKEALKLSVVDEIYVSNYQHVMLLD